MTTKLTQAQLRKPLLPETIEVCGITHRIQRDIGLIGAHLISSGINKQTGRTWVLAFNPYKREWCVWRSVSFPAGRCGEHLQYGRYFDEDQYMAAHGFWSHMTWRSKLVAAAGGEA